VPARDIEVYRSVIDRKCAAGQAISGEPLEKRICPAAGNQYKKSLLKIFQSPVFFEAGLMISNGKPYLGLPSPAGVW
jgi:hypothetical protein